MALDLIIRNVRLPHRDELLDIGVRKGVFARIAQETRESTARTLNVAGRYGIEEGKPANLIVLDAASVYDALRLTPERLHAIRDGQVVASTSPSQSRLFEADREELVTFVPNAPSTAD